MKPGWIKIARVEKIPAKRVGRDPHKVPHKVAARKDGRPVPNTKQPARKRLGDDHAR